jgi:hypothetical protein
MMGKARNWTLVAAVAVAAVASTAAYAASSSPLLLGPASQASMPTYQGLYDSHNDTYVITDVSSKSQASALHVNYAPALGAIKGLPLQYFVQGAHAAGQVTVFGSEPGESDYNPLWTEVIVTWKSGVKPTLLGSDDEINAAAKAGKVTMKGNGIVLNAPITKVGKGKS